MPQYLKDEVRERILDAARRAFARDGYRGATMGAIADAAGISTGNVYRYFGGKRELFRRVVPEFFVQRLLALLRERLAAADSVDDARELPPEHAYRLAAGRLLEFALEHRLEVVIVLGRAERTPYEDVAARMTAEMAEAGARHVRRLRGRAAQDKLDAPLELVLDEVYRNYVATLVRIMERFSDPEQIRAAIGAAERYHLVGLNALAGRNAPGG